MNIFKAEIDALAHRKTIRHEVLKAEQYDPDFPPGRLVDFVKWSNDLWEKIPEEYRDTAEIEFDTVDNYYDSKYAKVEVIYCRPETDDEWQARKDSVQARLAARESADRAQYEALKAKFDKDAG